MAEDKVHDCICEESQISWIDIFDMQFSIEYKTQPDGGLRFTVTCYGFPKPWSIDAAFLWKPVEASTYYISELSFSGMRNVTVAKNLSSVAQRISSTHFILSDNKYYTPTHKSKVPQM